jgi:hypothetical protein
MTKGDDFMAWPSQLLARDNYSVTKNLLLAGMISLFIVADLDARHDDIYESSISVLLALYIYLKVDKKSADMDELLKAIADFLQQENRPVSALKHKNSYHSMLGELEKRNYLKKGWQWGLLKSALILASLMKMAYGALTIGAVEKAFDRNEDWLQILLTVLGSVSSVILLTASFFSMAVSQSYYLASELDHYLRRKYPDNSGNSEDSTTESESTPLLGHQKKPITLFASRMLSVAKFWDIKSWGLNVFLALNSVVEIISVWNVIPQTDARTLEDTELLLLLAFMACDMFFNVAQAKILRYQQAPGAPQVEKSWLVESRAGLALTFLSILIPFSAKLAHLIMGIVARNPDNLDGFSCDTTSCRVMTGLSVAGVFALPAVAINSRLGGIRSQLYETSTVVTSGFTSFYEKITGVTCPAPISDDEGNRLEDFAVDENGFEPGYLTIVA